MPLLLIFSPFRALKEANIKPQEIDCVCYTKGTCKYYIIGNLAFSELYPCYISIDRYKEYNTAMMFKAVI